MQSTMLQEDVSLFDRALTDESRRSFLEHCMNKRGYSQEDADVMRVYLMDGDCTSDITKLAQGIFDFPLPRQMMLRKSHSDRRRIIYAYPRRQNMLLKYVAWLLHEYDSIFSDNLYSFRLRRSTADLFRQLTKRQSATDCWVVKADVHDYGHSIRPNLLIPKLQGIVGTKDPALMAFLEYLLTRDEFLRDDHVVHGCMGGLPGAPVGAFFNNVYLMELDEAMENSCVLSSRYADDIALFTRTREEAQDCLERVRDIASSLSLELNEDKTLVLAPGESFELLGIQVCGEELDVANSTMAKAKTRLGHYAHKLVLKEQRKGLPPDVAVRLMTRKVDRYFYGTQKNDHELSWREFFFRLLTRPDSLHELDEEVQGLIRYVATGKKTDVRYRFRYKDMQECGYKPLVSEYYRYREQEEADKEALEREAHSNAR